MPTSVDEPIQQHQQLKRVISAQDLQAQQTSVKYENSRQDNNQSFHNLNYETNYQTPQPSFQAQENVSKEQSTQPDNYQAAPSLRSYYKPLLGGPKRIVESNGYVFNQSFQQQLQQPLTVIEDGRLLLSSRTNNLEGLSNFGLHTAAQSDPNVGTREEDYSRRYNRNLVQTSSSKYRGQTTERRKPVTVLLENIHLQSLEVP